MRQLSIAKKSIKVVPITNSKGELFLNNEGKINFGEEYNFTYKDVCKTFYWSIIKYIRNIHDCGMPIVVFDKSPYHKLNYLKDYKSSRIYITQDDVDSFDQDSDPVEYFNLKNEAYAGLQKTEARKWIVNNFPKLGIPVLIHKGYEGDDLALLFSERFANESQKCGIVSIDSDWDYLLNPNVDHLKPNGEVINYDSMMEELNTLKGLSLYQYKSYVDSLFGSHNDLYQTISKDLESSHYEVIQQILDNENYVGIEDVELFKAQLKSFDIHDYPELDQVKSKIESILSDSLLPIPIEKYSSFSKSTEFLVTGSYYSNALNLIDRTLYGTDVALF